MEEIQNNSFPNKNKWKENNNLQKRKAKKIATKRNIKKLENRSLNYVKSFKKKH